MKQDISGPWVRHQQVQTVLWIQKGKMERPCNQSFRALLFPRPFTPLLFWWVIMDLCIFFHLWMEDGQWDFKGNYQDRCFNLNGRWTQSSSLKNVYYMGENKRQGLPYQTICLIASVLTGTTEPLRAVSHHEYEFATLCHKFSFS